MLFGAIDVGTNSIHLIVVEFDSTFDTTRVVYKDREMVRLGSNDAMERGRLSSKAMARGVDAIVRFVRAARDRGVERIRAVATSAVREAENGDEFRTQVELEAGIALEVVPATEEARLIHLGVANGYPIYDRLACIIDIGGGSTEFIVADGERPYLLDSVKLGVAPLRPFVRGRSPQRTEAELRSTFAPRSPADRTRPSLPDRYGDAARRDDHGVSALDAAARDTHQTRSRLRDPPRAARSVADDDARDE